MEKKARPMGLRKPVRVVETGEVYESRAAGADAILSYYALDAARWLREKP